MGTRSGIAIEIEPGKVINAYIHWDGYPEGVGATLAENYTRREEAESLIAKGDMSTLGATEADTAFYTLRGNLNAREPFESPEAFFVGFQSDTQYRYLWTEDGWRCYDVWGKKFSTIPFA